MLPVYEGLAPAGNKADFFAQLNGEGAKGFRFISGIGSVNAFVKDEATTYLYQGQDMTGSLGALQTQLNAMGAQGYRWTGPYSSTDASFELYRKDQNSTTTYSYSVAAATNASADFLAAANSMGASGYYMTGPAYMAGADAVTVFEKASNTAVYTYELLEEPTTADAFMQQLNTQGARGFRFRADLGFSDGGRMLYEKDATQSATFVFSALDPVEDFIAQANAQGQNGGAYIGPLSLPGGVSKTLYVTPSACSGILCVTRGPFSGA